MHPFVIINIFINCYGISYINFVIKLCNAVTCYSPTLYVVYKGTAVAMIMNITSYHYHFNWKTSQGPLAQSMFPLENKPISPASK